MALNHKTAGPSANFFVSTFIENEQTSPALFELIFTGIKFSPLSVE